jgi:hypothetical protein
MHKIIDKKFYLGSEFGLLINKKWVTISELLHSSIVYMSVGFRLSAARTT